MNSKIVIPISVIVMIVIVVFSLTQDEVIKKELSSEINDGSKIQNITDKIKEDKIKNDISNQPYYPSEREWVKSGPFQIDRSEYVLGEKIFINIVDLRYDQKGTMIFTKIINSTNVFEYKKINFDGSNSQQNFYLSIDLFDKRGICTKDQLIGDWELRFVGSNSEFASLDFKIKDQIIPGAEKRYESVC